MFPVNRKFILKPPLDRSCVVVVTVVESNSWAGLGASYGGTSGHMGSRDPPLGNAGTPHDRQPGPCLVLPSASYPVLSPIGDLCLNSVLSTDTQNGNFLSVFPRLVAGALRSSATSSLRSGRYPEHRKAGHCRVRNRLPVTPNVNRFFFLPFLPCSLFS